MNQHTENKVEDCIECLASGKNLKYHLPKNIRIPKTRETIRARSRNTNRLHRNVT